MRGSDQCLAPAFRSETLKYSGDADNTDTDHCYWSRRRGLSNVSSVEEAGDDERSQDKTNNLISEPKSKSPKYLPRFLRTSFSKLISRDRSKSQSSSSQEQGSSLPFFSSVSIPSLSSPTLSQTEDSDNNDDQVRPCSPATARFVEESVARGFPLIPFHYTSLDIVEKNRAQQRSKEQPHQPEPESSSPARAKYRRLHSDSSSRTEHTDLEEKSLQSVLNLAQQELEQEANEKKVI